MKLTVLGSSGTYPSSDNPGSGYLVTGGDDTPLLLDSGPGVYMALAKRVDPAGLRAVVLSHIHSDHSSDVFALMHRVLYGPEPARRVPLFAPGGAIDRLAGFAGESLNDAFELTPVGDGTVVDLGSMRLTFAAAEHSVPAVLTRVASGGASFVYTGDTGPTRRLIDLAAGTDLLIAEASLPAGEEWDFHMTARQAGEAASAAGAQALLLTHLRPTVDADAAAALAGEVFPGPVDVATPGMTIDFDEEH